MPHDKGGLGWRGSPRRQAGPVVWGSPATVGGTVGAGDEPRHREETKVPLMSHISFEDRLAGPGPRIKLLATQAGLQVSTAQSGVLTSRKRDTSSRPPSCAFWGVSFLTHSSAPGITWETTYQFQPQQTCPLPALEHRHHLQRKKAQIPVGKPEPDWNRAAETSHAVTGQNHVPKHPLPPVPHPQELSGLLPAAESWGMVGMLAPSSKPRPGQGSAELRQNSS